MLNPSEDNATVPIAVVRCVHTGKKSPASSVPSGIGLPTRGFENAILGGTFISVPITDAVVFTGPP